MEVSSAATTKESSKVLQGVCAYVEVRSQNENRSKVIAEELRKLGAEVHDKLNMNVTHVVFKDGTSRTWQRAKKLDIPLVSVLWVDGCKKTLEHINEKSFSVDSPEKDDRLFPVKRRKFRSMQPKDLNEEFEDISKRCDRKRKRAEKNKAKQNSGVSEPLTPRSFETVPHLKTPPSMKARLLELSKTGETREPIFAEENADDIKIKLFDNTEKKRSHPLSLPQSLSPIPCEKDFSEISPSVKKLKLKTPDLVSDIKLENISNNWKNLQTNNQNTTIISHDSPPQITKMTNLCERTSMEHTMTSAPQSPISSNVCNLSTDDFILDNKPIHRKRHKHRETLDFLGITDSNLNGRKHSTSISVKNKTEMSETRTSIGSSTPLPAGTLSSSKAELVTTCHEKTFADKTLFCNNSILTDNACTQSNAPENLQPQCDKIEMSETRTSIESSTPFLAGTLSSSKAELVTTCHEKTFADKTLLYNNSILTDNVCTQISAQDGLQPQCDSLKIDGDDHNSLSQSSFQSQVFPVNQTASVFTGPVPENPCLNLATTTENRNISLFRKPIKKHLVMTSMNSEEQSIVKSAVKSLGGCVISDNVRKSTTHVICGNSRRTLNLLHGLIQGCWLVSKQWIFESMEAGRWIDERKFEMTDDYPATKVYRQNKQKENLSIFKLCGPMFISPSTSPPKKDLVRFVQFCGGQVINNLYDADFYVSDEYNPFILSVSPQWILDSIMHRKVFPLEKYQLGQPKPQSPEY